MERDIQAYLDEPSSVAELAEARESDLSHDHGEDEDEDTSSNSFSDKEDSDPYAKIPVVLPRMKFAGICNVETVKDGASPTPPLLFTKC